MAITTRDLLFYDLVPWTREAWSVPVHSFPLIHTRLVQHQNLYMGTTISSKSSTGLVIPGITDVITFTLRFGTRSGVDIRVMRVETHRDLANWGRHLVEGAHFAAMEIKEVLFGIIYFQN